MKTTDENIRVISNDEGEAQYIVRKNGEIILYKVKKALWEDWDKILPQHE